MRLKQVVNSSIHPHIALSSQYTLEEVCPTADIVQAHIILEKSYRKMPLFPRKCNDKPNIATAFPRGSKHDVLCDNT